MTDDERKQANWRELLDGVRRHKKAVRNYIKLLESNPMMDEMKQFALVCPVESGITIACYNLGQEQLELIMQMATYQIVNGESEIIGQWGEPGPWKPDHGKLDS